MIEQWRVKSKQRAVIVCLSPRDGGNFRKRICTYYKAGRSEKPAAYWPVIEMIEAEFRVQRIEGLEADDVMGILATSDKLQGSVIVSIDKDMRTIPGWLLNPSKDDRPRKVSHWQANHFWMFQTLIGDRVDGYPGCPGIGEVKATRLLESCTNLGQAWDVVVRAFYDAGKDEYDALLQSRLARILQRGDYDKEKGTIRLWHPNPRLATTLSLAPV